MSEKKSPASKPSKSRGPLIAVTMGDAAGVGPELCVQLLKRKSYPEGSVPLVIGKLRVLKRVAKRLGQSLVVKKLEHLPEALDEPAVFDVPGVLSHVRISPGRCQAPSGAAAARFIEEAVLACQNGRAAAMVTAPINKRALNLGGSTFPGHTEMIAHLTGARRTAMLLYGEKLAVAFVTSHQPLRSVPKSLKAERIVEVAALLNQYLRLLRGGKPPRLAVLGLNPHAGEGGLFGHEEETIIGPAIRRIRALGIRAEGPVPPDAAFTPAVRSRVDGHVALYHDQGGIPFKMCAFDTGVNVTMGLEIIRTSPDHGTAYDIAWKGKASPKSFLHAYALAARLAVARAGSPAHRRISSRRLPALPR